MNTKLKTLLATLGFAAVLCAGPALANDGGGQSQIGSIGGLGNDTSPNEPDPGADNPVSGGV